MVISTYRSSSAVKMEIFKLEKNLEEKINYPLSEITQNLLLGLVVATGIEPRTT